jgi:hypothetical protein
MKVKPHHPLTELLAQLLHGIETVSVQEKRRMVNRACREAVKWHREQVDQLESWICGLEKCWLGQEGVCPECNDLIHNKDCKLFLFVKKKRDSRMV